MSDSGADETATKREGLGSLHRDVPGLDRGSVIGRYVVLDVIGQGGMGIIYSAFDPELDRKVAIKLLHADAGGVGASSAGGQTWLVREAQAMARLAHPNVVAVYDVGTLDDRVFVAMELVAGETLRDWLKREHSWREVLDILRAAGAGLVAAHAAGLVHRDFKPENVIVGSDGRVRVMDFGLARAHVETRTPASRDSDLSIESRSPLTDQLTEAGTVMGTPAYMAPEIHDGLGADALSDQFAFGVTLYEALFRMRPYAKSDLVPPRKNPLPKVPPDVGVPPRIERTVMRAISIDPKQRFPAMTELLAELAIDPGQTRRRVAIAAGFAVVAAGTATSLAFGFHHDQPCVGTERALAGVWDAPARLKVHTAFTATHKPWAEPSFAALAQALDRYTGEWTEAVTANCEATRIRKEQTERVFERRQVCYDQRLEAVRSLGKLLQEPPDALVDKADKAIQELDPISSCTLDASSFPDDPAQQKQYISLALALAAAQAQLIAGNYVAGLGTVQRVIDEGPTLHADDLVAMAQLMRGTVLEAAGNAKDGNEALSVAAWTAMRAHLDPIASKAALANAMVQSERADALALADVWLDMAIATARPNDAAMKFHALEVRGAIHAQRGELDAAVALHTQGLAAAQALYGKADDPNMWSAENQLATTLGLASAWADALPHFERALALRQAAVGPDHPDVALILSNLGGCYDHVGQPAKALAALKRAFSIKERTYGPNNPLIVGTLNNLADFEARHGELDAALADITRAKAIATRVPGTGSPLYHVIATTYAEVIGHTDPAAARVAFDEVLALETAQHSLELGTTLASRGELELAQNKLKDAVGYFDRSIAAYEAITKDHLALWKPLAGAARARRAVDPKADVRALLERAIAIGTKAQLSVDDMTPIRDALAKL